MGLLVFFRFSVFLGLVDDGVVFPFVVSWSFVGCCCNTKHSGLSIVVEGLEGFSGAQWLRRLLPYWGCWAQWGGYGVYALKVHVIFVMATESERPECVVSNSQQNVEVNFGFVEDLALDKNLSYSWDAWNLIEKTHGIILSILNPLLTIVVVV